MECQHSVWKPHLFPLHMLQSCLSVFALSLLFPSINWLAISWPISLWGRFGIYLIDFQDPFVSGYKPPVIWIANISSLSFCLCSVWVIAVLWIFGFYEEKSCIMREGPHGPHSRQNREQNEFLIILRTVYRSACIGQAYRLGLGRRRKREKPHFLILCRQIPGQSISCIQGRCGFNGRVLSPPHSLPFLQHGHKTICGRTVRLPAPRSLRVAFMILLFTGIAQERQLPRIWGLWYQKEVV